MNPLRPVILAAAKSARMRDALTRAPVTAKLVRRFVAGESRTDALAVAGSLLSTGCRVSIDYLGEDTTDRAQATATVTEYLALIGELGAMAASGDAEISVKLSALGQTFDPGLATEHLRILCAAASAAQVLVTVDAEDHTTTSATHDSVRKLRTEYPALGIAIQSYLYRAVEDCAELGADGARVRLCKGAYREPDSVAYQRKVQVTESYRRCLATLVAAGGYPMAATHDPELIAAATELAPDAFECQMLYGVNESAQQALLATGTRLRIYLPYGDQWYGYLMRRLAERPANAAFFLRSLVSR